MTLYPIILGLVNTTMGEGIGGVPYTVPGQCWVNCVYVCPHTNLYKPQSNTGDTQQACISCSWMQPTTAVTGLMKGTQTQPYTNQPCSKTTWWSGLFIRPMMFKLWAVLCGNINKVSVGPIWHFVRNKIRGGSKISLNKKDHLQQISYIKLIGTALHVFGIFMSENKNHVLSK